MVVPNPAVATSDTIAAASLLLTQMGLSPADLVAPAAAVPTFAEITPAVRATLEAGTRRTYGTRLNHLERLLYLREKDGTNRWQPVSPT